MLISQALKWSQALPLFRLPAIVHFCLHMCNTQKASTHCCENGGVERGSYKKKGMLIERGGKQDDHIWPPQIMQAEDAN